MPIKHEKTEQQEQEPKAEAGILLGRQINQEITPMIHSKIRTAGSYQR